MLYEGLQMAMVAVNFFPAGSNVMSGKNLIMHLLSEVSLRYMRLYIFEVEVLSNKDPDQMSVMFSAFLEYLIVVR